MRKTLFFVVILSMVLVACSPSAAPAAPAAPAVAATVAPAAVAPAAAPATTAGYGEILKGVMARGKLKCGVNPSNPGFSVVDSAGNYTGLDADMCRAVAAAVLGDPKLVEFMPTTDETRFTMLQNGDIDLLVRSTTWTVSRDTDMGLNFAAPYFYDGQGIMVRKDSGFTKIEDLNGATLCIGSGGTTELNVADAFAAKGLKYTATVFANNDDVVSTFVQGRCDAMVNDKSGLIASRTQFAHPQDYVILPDVTLSKEPLAPVIRQGDEQWTNIVNWTEFALWIAEEKGITSANVDSMKATIKDPEGRRLLGLEGGIGKMLGLSNDWAYNEIKGVGNFGEIWDRNLGPNTLTAIPRGINNLWNKGGLLYAPPLN